MLFMVFIASSFRVTDENELFETLHSGPIPFFVMLSLLLKELICIGLCVVTADGVVLYGGPKQWARK